MPPLWKIIKMAKKKRAKGKLKMPPFKKRDLSVYEDTRECFQNFNCIYVLIHEDLIISKSFGQKLLPSRLVQGSKRALKRALLDSCIKPEWKADIDKLVECVSGFIALLFTDLPMQQVLHLLTTISSDEPVAIGEIATMNLVLQKGPHPEINSRIGNILNEKWHIPTSIEQDVVYLLQDYEVCREGLPLTRTQFKVLKLLRIGMPSKSLTAVGCWSKDRGFEQVTSQQEYPEELEEIAKEQPNSLTEQKQLYTLCEGQGESSQASEGFLFVDDIE